MPKQGTPLWAALIVGVIGGSGIPLAMALPSPWGVIVGGALAAVGGTLATYYGMKSAGPREGT